MSVNALFARVTRTALAVGVLALCAISIPASAQLASGLSPAPSGTDTPAAPAAPAPIIQHIVIKGTQRIEAATVLT